MSAGCVQNARWKVQRTRLVERAFRGEIHEAKTCIHNLLRRASVMKDLTDVCALA